MAREKRERNLLNLRGAAVAVTGVAALAAVVLNALNAHKDRRRRKGTKDLPGSSLRLNLSASQILALADEIISKSKRTYDQIASLPVEKITYHDIILLLAELEAKQFPLIQSCIFPKMVSVYSDVRKASAEAERKLDSHFNMCRKREDVYRVLKAYLGRGERLSPEVEHYVEDLVRDFQRNGAGLSMSQKSKMESLKSQIEELSLQYIKNLNEDSNFLLFDEKELAGMPLEFIKSLEKSDDGKLKILLRSSSVYSILEHCKVGSTRNLVAVAQGQRCGEDNLRILENLVLQRHNLAELLGYSNYADYALEHRMPKTSSKVFKFMEDISVSITDLAIQELTLLRELKQKEEGSDSFGMEDMLYYMNKAEQNSDINFALVNHVFPICSVLSGFFKTFQDLFGLEITEVENVEVWHDSVRLFSVSDSSSHELLGCFYLDMFSREGKYSQTCVLALQNGCSLDSGTYQVPIALLVSSFRKQVDPDSTVLPLSDVITLFHELGHVVHQICNRASFARFSGLRVKLDFIEIPGQMLENWCYQERFLRLISGSNQGNLHNSGELSSFMDDTVAFFLGQDDIINTEVCRQLKRMRDSFSGLKLKQEILLCLIDLMIHSSVNIDIMELVKYLHPKVMLGIPLLEGTNPASSFPRLAVGYEASCYNYLWSEVFATDIFRSKFQDDIWNTYAGLEFRNKVFAPGGTKDPFEILRDYLGREPSIFAYIARKTRNSLGSYFEVKVGGVILGQDYIVFDQSLCT